MAPTVAVVPCPRAFNKIGLWPYEIAGMYSWTEHQEEVLLNRLPGRGLFRVTLAASFDTGPTAGRILGLVAAGNNFHEATSRVHAESVGLTSPPMQPSTDQCGRSRLFFRV